MLTAPRGELRRLKDEIARVQEIQDRHKPGHQSHGFVNLGLGRLFAINGRLADFYVQPRAIDFVRFTETSAST